jgi:ABC-type uncharacterized transport system ATPase subunit
MSVTPIRPMLDVNGIEVIYNHVILVLKGVSLAVPEGGVVALLGANGAGKTTTLKSISNLLRAERGEVTKGEIHFNGERVDRLNPSDLVKRGVVQVMEGRHCFGTSPSRRTCSPARTREARAAPKCARISTGSTSSSAAQAAPRGDGRVHVRRRAADDRDRARASWRDRA